MFIFLKSTFDIFISFHAALAFSMKNRVPECAEQGNH